MKRVRAIITLSTLNDYKTVRDLASAGIAGYILKSDTEEDMIAAIYRVAAGHTWFSQDVITALIRDDTLRIGSDPEGLHYPILSPQEHTVLDLLMQEEEKLTYAEIGRRCHIKVATVKTYVQRMSEKLCSGKGGRRAVVDAAAHWGLQSHTDREISRN